MIIIDTSQMATASALNEAGYNSSNTDEQNIKLVKHIFFNSVRAYNKKFKHEYGKLVFAIDSRNYWRKDVFPLYKYRRKINRENSDINWELIFKIKDEIISDLKEYFHYTVIEVDGAEADDIIATISKRFDGNHLIIATDKDYKQLHSTNIKQFCPRKKEFIKLDKPVEMITFEHIVRGDTDDGICNIKSPNNSLAEKIRQKPITDKFVQECFQNGVPSEFRDRFIENQSLIDHNFIPSKIVEQIIDQWNSQPIKTPSKIFNYLMLNKMELLLADIGDFN